MTNTADINGFSMKRLFLPVSNRIFRLKIQIDAEIDFKNITKFFYNNNIIALNKTLQTRKTYAQFSLQKLEHFLVKIVLHIRFVLVEQQELASIWRKILFYFRRETIIIMRRATRRDVGTPS